MAIRYPGIERMLCQAIRDRSVVRFRYDGQAHSLIFHSNILERSPKDLHVIQVSGIQARDESSLHKPPGYQIFNVAKIRLLHLLDSHFEVDENFRPKGHGNRTICVVG